MAKFGEHNFRNSKLTPSQVLEIRQRYAFEKWSQGRLAREYQVTIGTIGRIVRGESWQQFQQPKSEEEIQADAQASERRLREIIALDAAQAPEAPQQEVPEALRPKKPNPYF